MHKHERKQKQALPSSADEFEDENENENENENEKARKQARKKERGGRRKADALPAHQSPAPKLINPPPLQSPDLPTPLITPQHRSFPLL